MGRDVLRWGLEESLGIEINTNEKTISDVSVCLESSVGTRVEMLNCWTLPKEGQPVESAPEVSEELPLMFLVASWRREGTYGGSIQVD